SQGLPLCCADQRRGAMCKIAAAIVDSMMATDEELESVFGEPRPAPRQYQITEDEWRELTQAVNRIDRRTSRLCNWSVTALALPVHARSVPDPTGARPNANRPSDRRDSGHPQR